MAGMSEKFRELGGEIYQPVQAAAAHSLAQGEEAV